MDELKAGDYPQHIFNRGKVGLALSGGGLRASFFHLGVLASLADAGLLRHIEVISTVSGGSIIGALFYCYLKKILEDPTLAPLQDSHYCRMVEEMEQHFLKAVDQNIRLRVLTNPWANFRMRRPDYSRSDRIAELYDHYLYRPVLKPGAAQPVEMRELFIQPPDSPPGFYPRTGNQGREAKVPILLINATSINSGHNWRFQASRMGEPPRNGPLDLIIDKNRRYCCAGGYGQITDTQADIPLGHAVAASAAVPALFHPLSLSNLFPESIRMQLVDGGVHDNQGVQGLLDEGCELLIVSDASGQLKDQDDPGTSMLSVLGRTNSLLMDRVREEQLYKLFQDKDITVAFVNLKAGLPASTAQCLDRQNNAPDIAHIPSPWGSCEDFGVDPLVQEHLSKVRTDLDSFSRIESHSLMADGYLICQRELSLKSLAPSPASTAPRAQQDDWDFLALKPHLENPKPAYLRHLKTAAKMTGKPFALMPGLSTALAILAGLVCLWWLYANNDLLRVSIWQSTSGLKVWHLLAGAGLVLLLVFSVQCRRLSHICWCRWWMRIWLVLWTWLFVPCLAIAAFVWLHCQTFNRLFLFLGRVTRLKP